MTGQRRLFVSSRFFYSFLPQHRWDTYIPKLGLTGSDRLDIACACACCIYANSTLHSVHQSLFRLLGFYAQRVYTLNHEEKDKKKRLN
jgi:hypothetical protein